MCGHIAPIFFGLIVPYMKITCIDSTNTWTIPHKFWWAKATCALPLRTQHCTHHWHHQRRSVDNPQIQVADRVYKVDLHKAMNRHFFAPSAIRKTRPVNPEPTNRRNCCEPNNKTPKQKPESDEFCDSSSQKQNSKLITLYNKLWPIDLLWEGEPIRSKPSRNHVTARLNSSTNGSHSQGIAGAKLSIRAGAAAPKLLELDDHKVQEGSRWIKMVQVHIGAKIAKEIKDGHPVPN